MKSSDAKASKCHLKFSSRMINFIKLVYLSSVISLKLHVIGNLHCNLSEITELKYTSLIKYHSRRTFQMALRGFCIYILNSISGSTTVLSW